MWYLAVILAIFVHGSNGHSQERLLDWWETALVYYIYPRSFMDSDGDGIGDINGITSRLLYLKDLNVDAAWLAPIFKSPNNDYGFDVSEYYTLQPEYGTMEDFERLLHKAEELNIKILLDFVPNHTSNESDWFIRSTHKEEYYNHWYIWASGHIDEHGSRLPPNNWVSVFKKSAWTYVPARDQYYLHQFGQSQPDLNYRNPVVVDEIKTILKFWLEKGVAGFRFSTINHLLEVDKDAFGDRYPNEPITGTPGVKPHEYNYLDHIYTRDQNEVYDLVSQLRETFDSISVRDNLTRVMMTEASTGIKNAVRYYGDNKHRGAHIPLNYALLEDLDKNSDARDIKYAVDKWLTYKPLRKPANWMIGNHDKHRIATRFRDGLVDAFNMLVLLLPGIGITYMGEELGLTDGQVPWVETRDPLACNTDDPVGFMDVTRDHARTPFPWNSGKNAGFSSAESTWLPLARGYDEVNMDVQRFADRSHLKVYKALSKLRKRLAFSIGFYDSFAMNRDVFAFKRWHKDDTYLVVMNFGKKMNTVRLSSFDLVFGKLEVEVSSTMSSRSFNDLVSANALEVAPDEALVLRMQV